MFIVILIMFVGIGVGYLFRRVEILQKLSTPIFATICVLLFVLGLSVGSNEMVLKNLSTLGAQAFAIALAATSGSILAGWGVYHWFFEKKR